MKKKAVWISMAVLAIAAGVFWLWPNGGADTRTRPLQHGADASGRQAEATVASDDAQAGLGAAPSLENAQGASEEAKTEGEPAAEEPRTEAERREAEEEAKVDAFDSLTDKWMEPSAKGVTMADVDNFAKHFRQVPKARQDECVHRALNLVPDENVMLLAGILMDKSMDRSIVETVYNDILNRDEDVKKPILQQIFKDKTHPCWADTAWILDVTGELPASK